MPDDPPKASAAMWTVLFWLALVYFVAWMLAGCGVPCDAVVRGACIINDGPGSITAEAVERTLVLADETWGRTIDVHRYEITFESAARIDCSCGRACALGCTYSKWPDSRMFLAYEPRSSWGFDPFVLWHEFGHVAEPHASHDDPRFIPTVAVIDLCCDVTEMCPRPP